MASSQDALLACPFEWAVNDSHTSRFILKELSFICSMWFVWFWKLRTISVFPFQTCTFRFYDDFAPQRHMNSQSNHWKNVHAWLLWKIKIWLLNSHAKPKLLHKPCQNGSEEQMLICSFWKHISLVECIHQNWRQIGGFKNRTVASQQQCTKPSHSQGGFQKPPTESSCKIIRQLQVFFKTIWNSLMMIASITSSSGWFISVKNGDCVCKCRQAQFQQHMRLTTEWSARITKCEKRHFDSGPLNSTANEITVNSLCDVKSQMHGVKREFWTWTEHCSMRPFCAKGSVHKQGGRNEMWSFFSNSSCFSFVSATQKRMFPLFEHALVLSNWLLVATLLCS